jgi:hypothetical protein
MFVDSQTCVPTMANFGTQKVAIVQRCPLFTVCSHKITINFGKLRIRLILVVIVVVVQKWFDCIFKKV